VIRLALALVTVAQGPAARFESWNLGYAIPAGWQLGQQAGRVHSLTPGGAPSAVIYVGPGLYQTFNDVGADLNKGFLALGLTGMPTGQPTASTVRDMQAMTADYVGQNQMGMPLQAHAVAVLTPHGTGLLVLGLAASGQIAPVATAVDQIAQSLQASGSPQQNQQIVAALRGRWMLYAGKADGTTSASGFVAQPRGVCRVRRRDPVRVPVVQLGDGDDARPHGQRRRRAVQQRRRVLHGHRHHTRAAGPPGAHELRAAGAAGSHHCRRANVRARQLTAAIPSAGCKPRRERKFQRWDGRCDAG
jgi:hypothetical protein